MIVEDQQLGRSMVLEDAVLMAHTPFSGSWKLYKIRPHTSKNTLLASVAILNKEANCIAQYTVTIDDYTVVYGRTTYELRDLIDMIMI